MLYNKDIHRKRGQIMSLSNESVYHYIMEKAPVITEKWFVIKDGEEGSIYSKDSTDAVNNLLRSQHAFTIETVISSFLDDETIFSANLSKWANEIAKSRVKLGVPVHQVLHALSLTRQTIWEMITIFIEEIGDIPQATILHWSSVFHLTFDKLNNEFTEMYHEYNLKKIKTQQDTINELSNPIIPIFNHIGVLPIIGAIDTTRGNLILENVPAGCKEKEIRHLLIDLSGVSSIDTMVLQRLLSLVKILKYTGMESSISGLRPDIARVINNLGINLENVPTYSTLKQALSKLGLSVSS